MFESNYSSCTGRNSENICSSSGGPAKNKRQDETQFKTKIDGKTSLGPSYFAFYNSRSIYMLMLYHAKTNRSHPLIARLYR